MHGISHKGLVKAIVAIALVALMVVTPFASAQTSAETQTRADDDLILRIAMQDDIKTLNWLTAGDVWTWNVIGWVFDGLTWQNASNNDHVEPWAAEWFHHGPEDTWDTSVPYPDNDANTDYRNWTVKLREGIKWHDWESQTGNDQYVMGHDVVFSLRLAADVSRYAGGIDCVVARDADGKMIYGRDIADKVPGGIYKGPNGDWDFGVDVSDQVNYPDLPVVLVTVADDGLTLHYTLMKTYADFSIDTLNALIVPERIWSNHIADKLTWSDPEGLVSFGAFKFDFWDQTAQISKILTFRDYFRPEYDEVTGEMKPYIDAILFKRYGTTDAAVMALTSDEVDYIAWAIDPGFIDTINADPHLTLVRNSDLGFFYVAFNMRKPTFGYAGYDPADIPAGGIPTYNGDYTDVGKPFRVAFAHIINKQYIVSKFLQGFGSVGTSVVSPVNSFWYNPNIKIYNYDPAKAQEILDNAGWTDTDGDGYREFIDIGDDEITMLTPPADYDPIRAQSGLLIQQDAQAIGINLKSVPTNFGTIVQEIGSHNFDIYMLGWAIGGPTGSATAPCDFFGSKADGGGNNYPGYHNKSFDELCEQMNTELDLNKRRAIDFQLQDIIAEDVPYSVLYYRDVLEAYNNKFTGWVPRYGSIFNWYSLKELKVQPESNYKIDLSTPSTVNGGSEVTFTAYVTDKNTGDPIPGATVTFSVDAGDLSTTTVPTDSNGKAEVTFYAPEPENSLGVTVVATVHDAANNVDIGVTKFVVVLPPTEISLIIDTVPTSTGTANANIPADIEIYVSTGTGEILAPLNENNTGVVIDYQISPEGASMTYMGYENGGWQYQFLGNAEEGQTVQYTVTITAVYMEDNSTVSSASKMLTYTVVGPEPPKPPVGGNENEGGEETPSLGFIPVVFGVSMAAVVYGVYRKKR